MRQVPQQYQPENPRSAKMSSISLPTLPVAPTIAIFISHGTFFLHSHLCHHPPVFARESVSGTSGSDQTLMVFVVFEVVLVVVERKNAQSADAATFKADINVRPFSNINLISKLR